MGRTSSITMPSMVGIVGRASAVDDKVIFLQQPNNAPTTAATSDLPSVKLSASVFVFVSCVHLVNAVGCTHLSCMQAAADASL